MFVVEEETRRSVRGEGGERVETAIKPDAVSTRPRCQASWVWVAVNAWSWLALMPVYQVQRVQEQRSAHTEAEADQVTLADGRVEAAQLGLDYLDEVIHCAIGSEQGGLPGWPMGSSLEGVDGVRVGKVSSPSLLASVRAARNDQPSSPPTDMSTDHPLVRRTAFNQP